jgi:MFS family permease
MITAGFPTSLALLAYVVGPVPSIYGGHLADRYGPRRPLLIGYGLFIVLTVPTCLAIGSRNIAVAVLAVVVFTSARPAGVTCRPTWSGGRGRSGRRAGPGVGSR